MSDGHADAPDLGPVPPEFADPEERVEAEGKVTGAARFVADRVPPTALWAASRRSDVAHARIVRVDATAARSVPGVRAVVTAADIGHVRFGRRLLDQPVLAGDRVRFAGERIAAVAADSLAIARDAVQLIEVEYEELPPVLSAEAALEPDAPVLHEDADEYEFLGGDRPPRTHPNIQGLIRVERAADELERRFAEAAHVFTHSFRTPRHHHGYIEPHACFVEIRDDGVVHVGTTNKAPFTLRNQMSAALGIPPAQLDIDAETIGGDFGGKGYSIDEYVCYVLARATGRPVAAVMSYVEELAAGNPRHASAIRLRTAVDGDGRFLAHEARVLFDGGAYASAKPLPHLNLAGGVQTMAAYHVPSVRIEVVTAYTTTAPAGHMRAPGEVQAMFAGESHVDLIAREMGIDPIELRLRNVARAGQRGGSGDLPREPRARELLERLRAEMPPAPPTGRGIGRGVAIGLRHVGGGKTVMQVRLDPSGSVEVVTGIPDQGGGAHTVIRRVLAAMASISPERIRITRRSTATAPFDPGVGGSRTTHLSSQAAARAGIALKAAIEEAATRVIGEGVEQVELVDDWLVGEDGKNRLRLGDVASVLVADRGGISVEGRFESQAHGPDDPGDYNYGAYAAEVEVDPETGQVDVLGVTLVADVGTIINPVAHQGQLVGGYAFGFGQAVLEELVVDESGRVENLNLGEYKLPTSMDVPPIRTVLVPTNVGPGAFGAKMAGELSNTGVAPAIANAIHDACGVRLYELPLTAERVWSALRGAAPESP
jgi:CO/xanthine dehydrogenase Mo-binding subunit